MSIFIDIKKRLGDFSLRVCFETDGCVLALLGSSGCGKSMTLQCIAGILTPDEGRIVLDGVTLFDSAKRINLPPQKRQVGLLFQNYALFPNMTVAQNIAAGLRRRKDDRSQQVQALIKAFQLVGLQNHYPNQLSGGQQQRTALARMLAAQPKLIMLDEPFSAMDEYLRWQLEQELVTTLAHFGGTAIYVSHNRDEVQRICDKVCVLHEGKSEPLVSVARLFAQPQTLSAALLAGCKNFSRIAPLARRRASALDWGCELELELPPDVTHIGAHSHTLRLTTDNPMMRGQILRISRSVFSVSVILQLVRDEAHTALSILHMELPSEQAAHLEAGAVVGISVASDRLLLLR